MSTFCDADHISDLNEALKNDLIFDASLKTSTLLLILEILWNLCKNKDKALRKNVSAKTRQGVRKHKSLIKYLFDKNKSIQKRKRKFLKSKNSFKKFVKRLVVEFTRNCTDREDSS